MSQIKVLAIAAPENMKNLETILDHPMINRMATLQPVGECVEKVIAMPADALILMSPVLRDEEVDFLEKVYMNRGQLALILLCESTDTRLLSLAMRCGISQVLTLDMSPEEICRGIFDEVSRLQRRQDTAKIRNYDSRVLAICSTKGGSGKTSTAVNLAIALQQMGKKTVVLDLDLQFGDVGVFLNIPKCDTISDLVGEDSLTAATVQSYLYRHSSGIQVLCAPPSPELSELVKPEHIERLITVLRAEYDDIILDLAPVLDDCALMALDQCDEIFFVTNPEIHTLKNTRICMHLLKTLEYDRKLRLVLNKDGDPTVSRQDVEKALEMKTTACIPNDPKVCSAAINRGIPVVISAPSSRMGKAILKFAKQELESDRTEAVQEGKKKLGFFRRG